MKTNYERKRNLDGRYGGGTYVKAATVYLALFTTLPTALTGGTEVSYTGYARVAKTNNATNFPDTDNTGQKTNGTAIVFPERAAGGSTPEIVGFGWFDAAVGGNLQDFAAIQLGPGETSKPIGVGDTPNWGVGQLVWQET